MLFCVLHLSVPTKPGVTEMASFKKGLFLLLLLLLLLLFIIFLPVLIRKMFSETPSSSTTKSWGHEHVIMSVFNSHGRAQFPRCRRHNA